jgi:AcrR family transcriptional regulator
MATTRTHKGLMPLPMAGAQPAERADAARNRRALLSAARTILTSEGLDALTMDRLAKEAGVGVGTVYRRFSDRGGLAAALLDEQERQFQAEFLSGPPPLGPGAPPDERLRAYFHARLERLEDEAELRAWGEAHSPTGSSYTVGAYQAERAHVAALLHRAGADGEVEYLTDALLATTRASLFLHQRYERGISLDRMQAGVDRIVAGILPTS